MADEPPLLFRRIMGSLRPANSYAEEAMAALDDKPIRVRITRTNANTKRMALYWASLASAAPMLGHVAPGITPILLHRVLKDRAGLAIKVDLPSGDSIKDYDSISFASMTEPARAQYIDWALTTLSSWLGCDVTDLRREAQERTAA